MTRPTASTAAVLYEAPLERVSGTVSSDGNHSNDAGGRVHDGYKRAMYAIAAKPGWVTALEHSPQHHEYVLRSQAVDDTSRQQSGYSGHDFVFHRPRFYYRLFASNNATSVSDNDSGNGSGGDNSGGSGDQALVGSVLFTMDAEGPAQRAHGGSISAMFDQLLSIAAWVNDYQGFTGELRVRYERAVPLTQHLRLEARITSVERRKVNISMALFDDTNSRLAQSQGVWIAKPRSAGASVPLIQVKPEQRSKL